MEQTKLLKQLFVTVFILLLFIMWLAGSKSSSFARLDVQHTIERSKSCMTEGKGSEEFVLFLHNAQIAIQLMELYCRDPIIAKQFAKITAHWGGGDASSISYVGKGIASLVLAKENIMDAIHATETHGYQKIANYSSYKAFLIGNTEKPILSKEYLLDKKIALLEYPTSRSGHIIPKRTFANLGLSLDRLDIVYTSSHRTSRDLLASGEVDLISSYWSVEDQNSFSEDYKQELQNDISGSSWYLKMDKNNTVLLCKSMELLSGLAQSDQSNYYSNLNLQGNEQCEL